MTLTTPAPLTVPIPALSFLHVMDSQQFGHDLPMLDQLFRLADALGALDRTWPGRRRLWELLCGGRAFSLFAQDSTRTRWSLEVAAAALGMNVHGGSLQFSSMTNKGEGLVATARMAAQYGADILFLRHASVQDSLAVAAALPDLAIINGGSGGLHHPTQALGDKNTIRQHLGRLDHYRLLVVGHGRTLMSLIYLAAHYPGVQIRHFAPPGLELGHDDHHEPGGGIRGYLERHQVDFSSITDLREAMAWADIVYWTRLQYDMLPPELRRRYHELAQGYQLNLPLMSLLQPHAAVLHPLPIVEPGSVYFDRELNTSIPLVPEVLPEVEGHPQALWNSQARCAYETRLALILALLWHSPRRQGTAV